MLIDRLPQHVDLDRAQQVLQHALPSVIKGAIWSVGRNALEAVALPVPMGAMCTVHCRNGLTLPTMVIGFEGDKTLLASLDGSDGIAPGDRVEFQHASAMIPVGDQLIGRVIDAAGEPIDELGPIGQVGRAPLDNDPVPAMQRPPIDQILTTGVRAIDSMLTLGKGQRIGIFAGSGVGKSTLLGMMSRGTDADVVVIGLIGERGREVQEYLQRELDEKSRQRCVTVVATSDQPALRRVQAAMTATSIAEYFRDAGKNVLLMMDSVTRFAMAQREIGLAAGEAPTSRGYPPSVFSMLPRLVERSGAAGKGTITGIYTVLVEGDDTNEPISDTLRGLLDGHVVLTRKIAERGQYPAIDVLSSLSRLQHHLVDSKHIEASQALRNLMSMYQENEDVINIGAYQRGSNQVVDLAIAAMPSIREFLKQSARDSNSWQQTQKAMAELTQQLAAAAAPPANQVAVSNPANVAAAQKTQPAAVAQPQPVQVNTGAGAPAPQ